MTPFFIYLFNANPSLTNLNACHTLAKIDVLFHSYKFSPQNRNNLDLSFLFTDQCMIEKKVLFLQYFIQMFANIGIVSVYLCHN